MPALRKMRMEHLLTLRIALNTITNVAGGLSAQPRCEAESGGYGYNAAGSAIEKMIEWLNAFEQAVVNVARAAKPTTGAEIEYRGFLLAGFAADMEDDLGDLSVIVTEAARDEATARRQEAQARVRGAA